MGEDLAKINETLFLLEGKKVDYFAQNSSMLELKNLYKQKEELVAALKKSENNLEEQHLFISNEEAKVDLLKQKEDLVATLKNLQQQQVDFLYLVANKKQVEDSLKILSNDLDDLTLDLPHKFNSLRATVVNVISRKLNELIHLLSFPQNSLLRVKVKEDLSNHLINLQKLFKADYNLAVYQKAFSKNDVLFRNFFNSIYDLINFLVKIEDIFVSSNIESLNAQRKEINKQLKLNPSNSSFREPLEKLNDSLQKALQEIKAVHNDLKIFEVIFKNFSVEAENNFFKRSNFSKGTFDYVFALFIEEFMLESKDFYAKALNCLRGSDPNSLSLRDFYKYSRNLEKSLVRDFYSYYFKYLFFFYFFGFFNASSDILYLKFKFDDIVIIQESLPLAMDGGMHELRKILTKIKGSKVIKAVYKEMETLANALKFFEAFLVAGDTSMDSIGSFLRHLEKSELYKTNIFNDKEKNEIANFLLNFEEEEAKKKQQLALENMLSELLVKIGQKSAVDLALEVHSLQEKITNLEEIAQKQEFEKKTLQQATDEFLNKKKEELAQLNIKIYDLENYLVYKFSSFGQNLEEVALNMTKQQEFIAEKMQLLLLEESNMKAQKGVLEKQLKDIVANFTGLTNQLKVLEEEFTNLSEGFKSKSEELSLKVAAIKQQLSEIIADKKAFLAKQIMMRFNLDLDLLKFFFSDNDSFYYKRNLSNLRLMLSNKPYIKNIYDVKPTLSYDFILADYRNFIDMNVFFINKFYKGVNTDIDVFQNNLAFIVLGLANADVFLTKFNELTNFFVPTLMQIGNLLTGNDEKLMLNFLKSYEFGKLSYFNKYNQKITDFFNKFEEIYNDFSIFEQFFIKNYKSISKSFLSEYTAFLAEYDSIIKSLNKDFNSVREGHFILNKQAQTAEDLLKKLKLEIIMNTILSEICLRKYYRLSFKSLLLLNKMGLFMANTAGFSNKKDVLNFSFKSYNLKEKIDGGMNLLGYATQIKDSNLQANLLKYFTQQRALLLDSYPYAISLAKNLKKFDNALKNFLVLAEYVENSSSSPEASLKNFSGSLEKSPLYKLINFFTEEQQKELVTLFADFDELHEEVSTNAYVAKEDALKKQKEVLEEKVYKLAGAKANLETEQVNLIKKLEDNAVSLADLKKQRKNLEEKIVSQKINKLREYALFLKAPLQSLENPLKQEWEELQVLSGKSNSLLNFLKEQADLQQKMVVFLQQSPLNVEALNKNKAEKVALANKLDDVIYFQIAVLKKAEEFFTKNFVLENTEAKNLYNDMHFFFF